MAADGNRCSRSAKVCRADATPAQERLVTLATAQPEALANVKPGAVAIREPEQLTPYEVGPANTDCALHRITCSRPTIVAAERPPIAAHSVAALVQRPATSKPGGSDCDASSRDVQLLKAPCADTWPPWPPWRFAHPAPTWRAGSARGAPRSATQAHHQDGASPRRLVVGCASAEATPLLLSDAEGSFRLTERSATH
eukprot:1038948-Prymnesium_polylepis.2